MQINPGEPGFKEHRNRDGRPPTDADRAALVELARAPGTDPTKLQAISKMADDEIKGLIAANPNTPTKTLHSLWLSHPLRALENPILPYWSLREGKPPWRLLPMDVRIALYVALREPGCPYALEEHLPETERCVWFNATSADGPFGLIAASAYGRPRPIAMHAGLKRAIETRLASVHHIFATDPSHAVRKCLAESADDFPLPPAERSRLQRLLAQDPCPAVRRGIASSKQIHGELHTRLSKDPAFEVRQALARNTARQAGARLEGWHNLIAAGHAAEVAANPACPEPVQIELVCSGAPRERHLAWAGIRFHELTDRRPVMEVVERILLEPERVPELVQIARNQTIGGTLKSRLIAHHDVRVTRAVAAQKHLTEEQRFRLLFHADPKTALRAAKHAPAADFLDTAATHPNPLVRALLAKKRGENTWTLRSRLVDDPDPRVRAALCQGLLDGAEYCRERALHAAVIERSLTDPCRKVREVAARHPQFGRKRPRRR